MRKIFFGQLLLAASLTAVEPLFWIEETLQGQVCDLEPLVGGAGTTEIFRFRIASEDFVLRRFVDREAREIRVTRAMGELGVGPEVICVDPEEKWIVLRFIEGVHLYKMPALDREVMGAMRSVHAADTALVEGTSLLAFVRKRLEVLLEMETPVGREIAFACSWLGGLDESVQLLCHNDLHPKNVLYAQGRCWIIDWEAALLGDPFFDVAHWSLSSSTPLEQLLDLYLEREPTVEELERAEQQRLIAWLLQFTHAFPKGNWSDVQKPYRPLSYFWNRFLADEPFDQRTRTEIALICLDQFLTGALDHGDDCPLTVEVELAAFGGDES